MVNWFQVMSKLPAEMYLIRERKYYTVKQALSSYHLMYRVKNEREKLISFNSFLKSVIYTQVRPLRQEIWDETVQLEKIPIVMD